MQIDSLEAFHLSLPLRRPWPLAEGSIDTLQTVLVRMQSGDVVGWGEASPGNSPQASEEWAGSVFLCLQQWLMPALAGLWIDSGEQLQQRLAGFRGNRYAKSALDAAFWDLKARREGKPLHVLLDGSRDRVEVGPTFDRMETIDELLAAAKAAVDAGYARIGLKFRPGWDVHMVNLVRQEVPVLPLHIDCEGALGLEHMEMLCRLDDFMLAMVEQPLPADDLVGHAMVQETVRTPICLDEGISTPEQADMALELHSCRFVKIEPGRVGGLTPSLAIYEKCHSGCTPCWVGIPPQTAIGARAALALATKSNFTYPADFLAADLFAPEAEISPLPAPERDASDGVQRVVLSAEPGIGVEPDMARLEKLCIARTGK